MPHLTALFLAACLYLSALIIREIAVNKFIYGHLRGRPALKAYLEKINLCASQEDELEWLIQQQAEYWRQRTAYIFLRNAAVAMIVFSLGLYFFFTVKKIY